MTRSSRTVPLLAGLAAAALLAGCAPTLVGPGDATTEVAETTARESAAALADRIGTDRPDDIDEIAREAAAEGADLVGIESFDAPELGDAFGALTTRMVGVDGQSYCFRIEFDFYGRHSVDGVTVFGTTTGVQDVECDASTPSVTAPPDTREVVVPAANAEEAAVEVLTALPEDPGTIEDIAAAISERLATPTGPREVAAQPTVALRGTDVGVAMRHAEDCVLVKREAGAVTRVVVAPVLLQPGELGCTADTALSPAESLRPPH
ncbi:hypothetical protein EDF22_1682 [Rathayibacter sp. PhB127]|uniref:hypothetical protein n=1 Tax=Rathayibacter sp. PhB127 TaxID=2485176 RepID=UPI000FA6BC95|nr:hypothetical protein [Rathayibacter sp. PhB127]ROS29929.1 hypothetical protein EDF22_1682 [Rathayibacter sp. PhB127]